MSKQYDLAMLFRVASAAHVWWLMKRPLNWTPEQHEERPAINCATDSEVNLAEAVAALSEAIQDIQPPEGVCDTTL